MSRGAFTIGVSTLLSIIGMIAGGVYIVEQQIAGANGAAAEVSKTAAVVQAKQIIDEANISSLQTDVKSILILTTRMAARQGISTSTSDR